MVPSNSFISKFDENLDFNLKLKLEEVSIPGTIIVHVMGQLDTYNSSRFREDISILISSGFKNLLLDLSMMNYMSSTGIGCFTFILKSLNQRDGKMILFSIQTKVMSIFNILGFSTFFNITSNRSDAINLLLNLPKYEVKQEVSLFPLLFRCPKCGTKLKAPRYGKFKCARCKSLIVVDHKGSIVLL